MLTNAEKAKAAEKEALAKIQANELKKIETAEAQEKTDAKIAEAKKVEYLGLNVYLTADGKYYRGKVAHLPGDASFVFPTRQMRAVLTDVPMLKSEMDHKITLFEIEEEKKRVKL